MENYKTAKELLLDYLENVNKGNKVIELFAQNASIKLLI